MKIKNSPESRKMQQLRIRRGQLIAYNLLPPIEYLSQLQYLLYCQECKDRIEKSSGKIAL